ncbi:MAG TPA: 30S ribosomal protein S9 [Atribacteraceae bacterium]|nr:30S ribosomal protein S9 [Atribacteraceae bacterium]
MNITVSYYATGRRKTSIARVRLMLGNGKVIVNGKSVEQYFTRPSWQIQALKPLVTTGTETRFDVEATAEGGGLTGQAGAVALGIARALVEVDERTKPALKKAGLLTRDSRMKERKKYGLRGARARFQFSKR